ncbi:hypothetical protein HZS_4168 [Henneguya salminicola]|nr:hypothetical protein HZS_4168 [Henneguya salminicola]
MSVVGIIILLLLIILCVFCGRSVGRAAKKQKQNELLELNKFQIFGFTTKEMCYPYYDELNYSLPIGHLKPSEQFKIPLIYLKFSFSPITGIFTLIVSKCENLKPKNEVNSVSVSLNLMSLNFETSPCENVTDPQIDESFQLKIDSYYKFRNKRLSISNFEEKATIIKSLQTAFAQELIFKSVSSHKKIKSHGSLL